MTRPSVFAICGADWRETTRAMSGVEPATSPPLSAETKRGRRLVTAALARASQCDVLYLNLHGYHGKSIYCGMATREATYPPVVRPVVLTPSLVSAHTWRGTIVYAEICYSAADTPGNRAMARAFLDAGCSAFVGSTTQAWGRVTPVGLLDFDGEADRLGAYFLRGLARRPRDPGRALAFAKRYLRFVSSLNGLDAEDRATLNGFVVLTSNEEKE